MKTALLAAGLEMLVLCSFAGTAGLAAAPLGEEAAAKRVVVEEALRAGFPPSLALAVADAASGFKADYRGDDGALGIMQLRPRTAWQLGLRNPAALSDARVNARLGISYLEQLVRAHNGELQPALAQMERGVLPQDAQTSDIRAGSLFVRRVVALHQRYRAEAQSWVDALKGAVIAWDRLRPDDGPLRRLAALARTTEGPSRRSGQDHDTRDRESVIERRRRAVLPYLDDFSG